MVTKRGRPRQPLPKGAPLKPEGGEDGPFRTPLHVGDPGAGKAPYAVKFIVAEVLKRGLPHYIVRWEDLPSACDTVEPEDHLCDPTSEAAIERFKAARDEANKSSTQASVSTGTGHPITIGANGAPEAPTGDGEVHVVACTSGGTTTTTTDAKKQPATVRPFQRKGTSDVWAYFTPKEQSVHSPGHWVTHCKFCDFQMSACNTSNLRNHLIRQHSSHLLKE